MITFEEADREIDEEIKKEKEAKMRTFHTGATRNSDGSKLDFEGFLSPLVIKRYAEYLHKHRTQADGKMREGDNWQKGIPLSVYAKSLWRHLMSFWMCHRYPSLDDIGIMEDALCAIIFNASGYLFELETIKLSDPDPACEECPRVSSPPHTCSRCQIIPEEFTNNAT